MIHTLKTAIYSRCLEEKEAKRSHLRHPKNNKLKMMTKIRHLKLNNGKHWTNVSIYLTLRSSCYIFITFILLTFLFFIYYREQQKALKEAAEKAGKKGPMVGGGIKKSGKKWNSYISKEFFWISKLGFWTVFFHTWQIKQKFIKI